MRHNHSFLAISVLVCTGILFFAMALQDCQAKQPVKVEILFMNHGPMQPTIRNLKALFSRYSGKVQAFWFDFEKRSGKNFMKRMGIQGHIPLLIYVNGANTYDFSGRKVSFMGFPSGAGPYQFQGKWTLEDLDKLLKSLASQ
jgi:hypothetical protein